MFGNKRKTANEKFVLAQGRAAGNLKEPTKKAPKAQPPKKNDTVKKAAPLTMTVSQRQKMGSLGVAKT